MYNFLIIFSICYISFKLIFTFYLKFPKNNFLIINVNGQNFNKNNLVRYSKNKNANS